MARSVTQKNQAGDRRLLWLTNDINQTKHYRQFCYVGNHLQATCGIHKQRQEVYCAYLDHTRFVPMLRALQFGECVLDTLSCTTAQGNLERHKRERIIPSRSHSDTCVFESIEHVPPSNLPQLPLNPTLHLRRQRGSDPNDQQRTKPKLEACHKNALSRFGLVV